MTLKADIAADRDVFIDPDEFGEAFVYNAVTIYGVFDNAYETVEMGEAPVSTTQPAAEFKASDVTGIAQGDTVTRVDGGVVYNVARVEPDGRGWSMVIFSQD